MQPVCQAVNSFIRLVRSNAFVSWQCLFRLGRRLVGGVSLSTTRAMSCHELVRGPSKRNLSHRRTECADDSLVVAIMWHLTSLPWLPQTPCRCRVGIWPAVLETSSIRAPSSRQTSARYVSAKETGYPVLVAIDPVPLAPYRKWYDRPSAGNDH